MGHVLVEEHQTRLLADQRADILGNGDPTVGITDIQGAVAVIGDIEAAQGLLQVEGIVALAPLDDVVTTVITEGIVAATPFDVIVATAALEQVIGVAADDK